MENKNVIVIDKKLCTLLGMKLSPEPFPTLTQSTVGVTKYLSTRVKTTQSLI